MGRHEDFLSERDRALLERAFHIDNPETLPGLVPRIPKGMGLRTIVYYYDVKPPKGTKRARLRCAHCYMPIHWKGYVIELEDGSLALLGNDCGEKQFGLDFNRVANAFKDERKRHNALHNLMAIRAALDDALDELTALPTSVPVVAFDTYMNTLRRKFGKFSQVLAKTVRSSQGRLIATEMVRDEAAEERQARARDDDGLFDAVEEAETTEDRRIAVERWRKFVSSLPKCWKRQPVDMGACEAWSLLSPDGTPAQLIGQGIAGMQTVAPDIRTNPSANWTLKELEALPKILREALAKLDAALKLLADLTTFTGRANIERIASWAQEVENLDGTIRQDIGADGRALVDQDTDVRLELPSELALPSLARAGGLRSALA